MTAPVARALDRETLVAAVAAEGSPVKLSGAVLRSGWESVVLETVDGWILRFPRDGEIDFDRELAILDRLAGRVPVPIPRVEWTGRFTRFAAYRRLDGATLDPGAYERAPTVQRDAVADSLARFLYAMHTALSANEIAELEIPHPLDHHPGIDRIVAEMDRIPVSVRPGVERLVEEHAAVWSGPVPHDAQVLLHNDFHIGNLVLSEPVGEVTGVWDFSCVEMGLPSMDLRYFDEDSWDLLLRLAERYERASGRPVDVTAAVLANHVEMVSDALETDEPETIPPMLARWRAADAERAGG